MVASLIAQRVVRPSAGPFLKWAGGKTQLLREILAVLPESIETYYEPFIGGGAVFFALASEGRMKRAILSDQNEDLIGLYQTVRDQVELLIKKLSEHERFATDEDYYYDVRSLSRDELDKTERAARFLFLNKTCYNGLYRVNRRGQFNVPFGRYANPTVCNAELLRAASLALRGVAIERSDFEASAENAGRGDAVYFDPPYHPVSATANFTSYGSLPFGPDEHRRLAQLLEDCRSRGATVVLSNSDCPFTRSLYPAFDVRTVNASRAINSDPTKRGKVTELLVVGTPVPLRAVRARR